MRVNPLDTTDFTPGRPVELAPGIRRLVADNAGMMTGPGTNTYLIGRDRVVVVDPGPALPGRVETIERALAGTPVDAVVVTHTHNDHSPAAAPLAARLGVPLLGRLPGDRLYQDASFQPTRSVEEGDEVPTDVGALRAVTTPGHASNHVCWYLPALGYLCTGDHVLGTVSPVIVHPDGDLTAYLQSLAKVKALRPTALLPGHGPVVTDPDAVIDRLVKHRLLRETRVLAALQGQGCRLLADFLPQVYADVPPALHAMARHTLLAHLFKLAREGRVEQCGEDAWRLL